MNSVLGCACAEQSVCAFGRSGRMGEDRRRACLNKCLCLCPCVCVVAVSVWLVVRRASRSVVCSQVGGRAFSMALFESRQPGSLLESLECTCWLVCSMRHVPGRGWRSSEPDRLVDIGRIPAEFGEVWTKSIHLSSSRSVFCLGLPLRASAPLVRCCPPLWGTRWVSSVQISAWPRHIGAPPKKEQ